MAKFSKSYNTPEEYDLHYYNFLRSQHSIDTHNSQGKSYFLGHNAQSDWSDAERKARLGDKTIVSPSAELRFHMPATDETPIDWRAKYKVNPIKD